MPGIVLTEIVIYSNFSPHLENNCLFVVLAVSAAPGILSQRAKLERAKVSLVTSLCVCLVLDRSFTFKKISK